jgi:hypothetical protein
MYKQTVSTKTDIAKYVRKQIIQKRSAASKTRTKQKIRKPVEYARKPTIKEKIASTETEIEKTKRETKRMEVSHG